MDWDIRIVTCMFLAIKETDYKLIKLFTLMLITFLIYGNVKKKKKNQVCLSKYSNKTFYKMMGYSWWLLQFNYEKQNILIDYSSRLQKIQNKKEIALNNFSTSRKKTINIG